MKILAKTKTRKPARRNTNTDEQVLAMARAGWQWGEQLRTAARERGLDYPSVASIVDVIAGLRALLAR